MKRARKKEKNSKIIPISSAKKVEKKPKNANGSKAKKGKKGKKALKIVLSILIVLIVLIFIALGFGGGDNALIPVDTSTGKINVLLLGTDEDGLRTDAIMVASYDFDNESVKLLSIPRDTKMYVTNKKKTRKINEIHAMSKGDGEIMGPLGSVEAVTAITGIPINYYVEFNFDAIDEIADILGPVTFDVPDIEGNGKGMNYDDPVQDLHIHLKPGVQELSGNQYQQFLRYRKSNNEKVDGSDLSRVGRQHEFVKAIIDQKVNLSLIVKVPDIYAKVKKNIKTNFSAGEIAKYSTHLLNLTSENISTFSLPGEDLHTTAWYFECNFAEAKTLIETEFGYDASEITNKVAITGEKIAPGKANTEKADDTEKTSAPQKATASPSKNDDGEKAGEKTASPTKEPEKTESPTAAPTAKATEAPKKTEEPQKTVEPLRPTANPSDDDDVIEID